MAKIQLKATHVIVAVVCLILLLSLIFKRDDISKYAPRPSNILAKDDYGLTDKINALQSTVNELKASMRAKSSQNTDTLPGWQLAYEHSSPSLWARRKAFRDKQVAQFNTVPLGSETANIKKFFQEHWEPTFSCTFPTRLGNIGDGGKWVCNPEDILASAKQEGRKVLIYSLGSNSEYSFETAMHKTFENAYEIHTFDMGAPRVPVPPFINFHQWKMVGEKEETGMDNGRSLSTIRRTLGHVGKTIDIFKIDIEGSEYSVLKTFMTPEGGCMLNANMVLMETHWGTSTEYNDLFQRLTTICGMELYYKEPNIEYSNGEVLEWCFVKVDWSAIPK